MLPFTGEDDGAFFDFDAHEFGVLFALMRNTWKMLLAC